MVLSRCLDPDHTVTPVRNEDGAVLHLSRLGRDLRGDPVFGYTRPPDEDGPRPDHGDTKVPNRGDLTPGELWTCLIVASGAPDSPGQPVVTDAVVTPGKSMGELWRRD
jgi:hypothetical protein